MTKSQIKDLNILRLTREAEIFFHKVELGDVLPTSSQLMSRIFLQEKIKIHFSKASMYIVCVLSTVCSHVIIRRHKKKKYSTHRICHKLIIVPR